MTKVDKYANDPEAVDEFLAELDHPLKAEVQAVREIIRGAAPGIKEQVKWNAPSFSYKDDYLVTFNLRARDRIHLVFHNPAISKVNSPLLEGDYEDRRIAYFTDMGDIEAKRDALEKAVQGLVQLADQSS
jgi:uncharacterized protein YdhG (YjbR/CyaY superfamily)